MWLTVHTLTLHRACCHPLVYCSALETSCMMQGLSNELHKMGVQYLVLPSLHGE